MRDHLARVFHRMHVLTYPLILVLYLAFYLTSLLSFPVTASSTIKVYQFTQQNGVVAFSDQAPKQQQYQVLQYQCFACRPQSTIDWHRTRLFTEPFQQSIQQAASTYALDTALIRAVIHAESAFQAKAVSPKGAQGLMQLMPATAKEFGSDNSFDSHSNIMAGSAYLAHLLTRYQGNTELALAAYNAGPAKVKKYAGIPPYAETQAYVKRVHILLTRYRQAMTTAHITS